MQGDGTMLILTAADTLGRTQLSPANPADLPRRQVNVTTWLSVVASEALMVNKARKCRWMGWY
jgi:hypothetical protein